MAKYNRRQVVVGGATAALAALAGCTGNGNGDGDGNGATPTETDTATETATNTPTEGQTGPKQLVATYLTSTPEADNFQGTVKDMTGKSEVTVKVGAKGNGGDFAFAPPAMTISSGTTIRWEWTGNGGDHNVESTGSSDFDFKSGPPMTTGSYKKSFDSAGVGLYFCSPHKGLGMKGGFVVV